MPKPRGKKSTAKKSAKARSAARKRTPKRKSKVTRTTAGAEAPPADDEKPPKGRLNAVIFYEQRAIRQFAKFIEDAADLTMKGDFRPGEAAKKLADLWRNWAVTLTDITREVLKDKR